MNPTISAAPDHRRLLRRLLLLVAAALAFGFALAPLYDIFCAATGFNGRTGNGFGIGGIAAAEPPSAIDFSRTLRVEFTGTVMPGLAWEMRPLSTAVDLHPSGPRGQPFTPMAAWGIPAINTALLLSSGATVTWAHWSLLAGRRRQLNLGLLLTVLLGFSFISLQAWEYHHAYSEMGLTLGAGAYGATFFMLTGFHGFHVTLGAIMLSVILGRCWRGHFTPEHHFAFEGVAWYWHFVDVVWLLLFVFVYWL